MIRLPTLHRMIYSSFPTFKYSLIDTITQSDVIMIIAHHISLFVGRLLMTHFTRLLSHPPWIVLHGGGREVYYSHRFDCQFFWQVIHGSLHINSVFLYNIYFSLCQNKNCVCVVSFAGPVGEFNR